MSDPVAVELSSVDPTAEAEAILARLRELEHETYEGVPQGVDLPTDQWGDKEPYRDFESGSVVEAAQGRRLGVGEQAQPYVWSFQVHHTAPTREALRKLCAETDRALIGWSPSENAGTIGGFYFTMYDEFNEKGERLSWTGSRFYSVTLGMAT